MKIAAILPAKGKSDRIPNKNKMLLDGEPLFIRSLKKLTASSLINEVYLDTESEEIIEMASEADSEAFRRDVAFASNRVDGNQLLYNAAKHIDADIYVQLLCTSPFIKLETIEKGVSLLLEHRDLYDSVVAVYKEKQYLWKDGWPIYDINQIPNSVDLEDTTRESMGLYIITKEALFKTGRRIGDKPYLLELEPLEAIDVNWPEDCELANLVAIGLREQERRLFQNLRSLLSSPLISDIFDESGMDGLLSSKFNLNLPGAKILGRAKTMQIDHCEKGEDYKKIYDSLNLYDHVVTNDVIVVANNVPDYAFFGELNTHLAIRSGAVGAIIDGVTRDSVATQQIGFPVFSKGNYAKDTKKRAIVTSRNKTVVIDGIKIRKDDLIFGDKDGIAIIPKKSEKVIIERALEVLQNENMILVDIAKGAHTKELVQKYGFF